MWKVINKCQTDQKSGRQFAFFYTDVFKIQPKPVSFCLFFVTIVTYMWIMACHQNQWTCQFATNFDDDGCSMFALQCKYRERDCMVISCLCIQWILFIFSHSRSHAQSLTYSFNESLLSSYLLCAVGSYSKLNGSAKQRFQSVSVCCIQKSTLYMYTQYDNIHDYLFDFFSFKIEIQPKLNCCRRTHIRGSYIHLLFLMLKQRIELENRLYLFLDQP